VPRYSEQTKTPRCFRLVSVGLFQSACFSRGTIVLEDFEPLSKNMPGWIVVLGRYAAAYFFDPQKSARVQVIRFCICLGACWTRARAGFRLDARHRCLIFRNVLSFRPLSRLQFLLVLSLRVVFPSCFRHSTLSSSCCCCNTRLCSLITKHVRHVLLSRK
jgi:hypothetical protein